jgi:CBS domain-containing protein
VARALKMIALMRVHTTLRPGANTTPISEIMTTDVVCVAPELSVETLALMMLHRGFSGAPVVDSDKKAIGVVSKTDILRRSYSGEKRASSDRPVAEIMTPVAFTLCEEATIAEAAALMAFEGTHRLPVVSRSGVVVGIVSSIDVLRWIAETEGYLVGRSVRK